MNQIFGHLKRIVVFSLDVSGAFKVLKDLASRGIFDLREPYEDISRRIGVGRYLLNEVNKPSAKHKD